jgi:hypothetical protein
VTFVASIGDAAGQTEYPATSPNVLAVGGTTLRLSAAGTYVGETAWGNGGGGLSPFEVRPAFQKGITGTGAASRSAPDVAFDADPSSGVTVYDSFNNGLETPWVQMGGTSLAAPAWAALIAVANQGRALAGIGPLDGPTQTLPEIYRMPGGDFHDVIGGVQAVSGPGYDRVTGRGSPVANRVVNYLVQDGSIATHFRVMTTSAMTKAGASLVIRVTALDANNNPVVGYRGTIHFSSSDPRSGLPSDYTFTAADGGSHTFSLTFKTVGNQTLHLRDRSSATGGLAVNVSPGLAARLRIATPPVAFVGVPFRVTVYALDAYGNLVEGYRGTVQLSSSDRQALFSRSYTYRTFDKGGHTFVVTMESIGTWSVNVEDSVTHGLRGTSTVVVRAAPLPSRSVL